MSSDMFSDERLWIQQELAKSMAPSFAIAVGRNGETLWFAALDAQPTAAAGPLSRKAGQ